MSRKGILASDPSIKDMNPTRWAFEYYALATKENETMKNTAQLTKDILVNVLGLNILRPTDGSGNPKTVEEMTEEERQDYIPLTAWVGREEMLEKVSKQLDKYTDPGIINADKEYEALAAKIDESPADMEPILGLDKIKIPENPRLEKQKKELGIKDIADIDIDGKI